jgi:hypothetical protein
MKNNKIEKQQIIDNLKLSSLTPSQQDKIIKGLMDNIAARINMAVLDNLSSDEKKEFFKVLKSKKKSSVLKFLNKKIENFSDLAEKISVQTVSEFKK